MSGFSVSTQIEALRNAIGTTLSLGIYEPANLPDLQGFALPACMFRVGAQTVMRAQGAMGDCTVTVPIDIVYIANRVANTQSDKTLRAALDTISNQCHNTKNWPDDSKAAGIIACDVVGRDEGGDPFSAYFEGQGAAVVAGHVSVVLTLDAS